jgi:hypothetical protein
MVAEYYGFGEERVASIVCVRHSNAVPLRARSIGFRSSVITIPRVMSGMSS